MAFGALTVVAGSQAHSDRVQSWTFLQIDNPLLCPTIRLMKDHSSSSVGDLHLCFHLTSPYKCDVNHSHFYSFVCSHGIIPLLPHKNGSEQESVRPPGFLGFPWFGADGLTRFHGPGSESSPMFTDLSAAPALIGADVGNRPFPSMPTTAMVQHISEGKRGQ